MSFIDKAKHKAEEVSGNVKQTGDSVKDAASDIAGKFKS